MSAATLATKTQDEAEIVELLDNYARAIETKNVDGIVQNLCPNILLYDAIPPFETRGVENYRKMWEGCFPYLPKKLKLERHGLQITVGGDLAVASFLSRMVPIGEESPCGKSWLRITVCFKRVDGKWGSFHEHVSQPFNPMTNEIVNLEDPNEAATPIDWSAIVPQQ